MNQVTLLINEAPYGNEKAWNALRYSMALLSSGVGVKIFLMADATSMAKRGQETPTGYYNLEKMLKEVIERGAPVKL